MEVKWSDRLEDLAEGMFKTWEEPSQVDPFARRCVVTDSAVCSEWLKRFWLVGRRNGGRCSRVLANVDFKMLYPFVNDVMYAAAGNNPDVRSPSNDVWSKDVLTWRVDSVLRNNADDFPNLKNYIGTSCESMHVRRLALAKSIAQMFDEYATARPERMKAWERIGEAEISSLPGDERWQARLWRKLRCETGDSGYIDAFAGLRDGLLSLDRAFDNGIPRYRSIDVFCVDWMPRVYLEFFRKLADLNGVDVRISMFNPSREMWFDDAGLADARKRLAKKLRDGSLCGDMSDDEWVTLQNHPILGMYATGAQGTLGTMADDFSAGKSAWVGRAGENDAKTRLSAVQQSIRQRELPVGIDMEDDGSIQIHVVHSPRREMEVLRDSINTWLAGHENGSRHPSGVLVLCADYESYVPYIESVFAGSSLPKVRVGRGVKDAGPIPEAFLRLLSVPRSRFDASLVTGLLSVDPIAAKFGLDARAVSTLPDLLRRANIHWGRDEASIRNSLGMDAAGESSHPFSWERGLQRLALGMLGASDEHDERNVIDGGKLRQILPTARVNDGCSDAICALYAFVDRLCGFADAAKSEHTINEWRDMLLVLVNDMFKSDESSCVAIIGLNRAVVGVAEKMQVAATLQGVAARQYDFSVIEQAVKDAVEGSSFTPAEVADDAIVFAPLKLGNVYPADLVCVCGLNSGVFPRADGRAAFDLIGQRPTLWDKSSRRADLQALLEAVMSARETLSLSYVGRSNLDNSEIPPSVALSAFEDYVNCCFKKPQRRMLHKLQPYNAEYFLPADKKGDPRLVSWSGHNLRLAKKIAEHGDSAPTKDVKQEFKKGSGIALLDSEMLASGEMDIARFADLLSDPCKSLAGRLGIVRPYLKSDGGLDTEPFADTMDERIACELALSPERTDEELHKIADGMVERGAMRTHGIAESFIAEWREAGRNFAKRKIDASKFGRIQPAPTLVDALRMQEATDAIECRVGIDVGGGVFTLKASPKILTFDVPKQGRRAAQQHNFHLLVQTPREADRKLHHWLLHLLVNAQSGKPVYTVVVNPLSDSSISGFNPIDAQTALSQLQKIVVAAATDYTPAMPFFMELVGARGTLNTVTAKSWNDMRYWGKSKDERPMTLFWSEYKYQTEAMMAEMQRIVDLVFNGMHVTKVSGVPVPDQPGLQNDEGAANEGDGE